MGNRGAYSVCMCALYISRTQLQMGEMKTFAGLSQPFWLLTVSIGEILFLDKNINLQVSLFKGGRRRRTGV